MNKMITLKASNLKYLGADGEQYLAAHSEKEYPILLQELPGGKVHLRSMKNGLKYFEAINGGSSGILVRSETPNENCEFTLHKLGGKHVSLIARSGQILTLFSDGRILANRNDVGPNETFYMNVLHEQATKPAEYKKLKLGGSILWNDHTHAAIVDTTLRLLTANHADNAYVKALRKLTDYPAFKAKMLEGLKDADYKVPYIGILWSSHFYNPHTGKNYIGLFATALDNGVQYFNESQVVGLRIYDKLRNRQDPSLAEIQDCGYKLGLALHYVTDLTQPMHSSNYTNIHADNYPLIFLCEKRHSGLEQATEDLVVNEGYLNSAPAFTYDKFNPDNYASAAAIIHEAALISNATFVNRVKPILDRNEVSWFGKDVRAIADASIKTVGLHSVARFLAFWAKKADRQG